MQCNQLGNSNNTTIKCASGQHWLVEDFVKIISGNDSTLNGTDHCKFDTGATSVVICRHHCEVNAGDFSSVSTASHCNVKTGIDCTASVGPGTIVCAGDGTEIKFSWWMGDVERITRVVIGTNGYTPNTPYRIQSGTVVAVN